MRTLLLATCAALCFASAAHATNPKPDPDPSPVANANAAAVAGVINDSFNTSVNNSIKVDDHSIRNTATGGNGGLGLGVGLGGKGGAGGSGGAGGQGGSATGGSASSDQDQTQRQQQTATSDQHQRQSASSDQQQTNNLTGNNSDASSSSAGQTATFTDNSVYQQRKPSASSAYAAAQMMGSLSCGKAGVSAAGQARVLGFSFGAGTKDDDECDIRATSDAWSRGPTYEGCVILMQSRWSKALLADVDPRTYCLAREYREASISVPVAVPVAPPRQPTEMKPIPNPVNDGERGR